jgi:anti-sigma B factor antagonist
LPAVLETSWSQYVDGLVLSSEQRGESVVISIAGDLDIVTSPALDDCLNQTGAVGSQVILDLSAVEFMDTSALAVIVGHWKKIEAAGGELALAGARYRYTKTLWITGLADRLRMYDSVDAALGGAAVVLDSSGEDEIGS